MKIYQKKSHQANKKCTDSVSQLSTLFSTSPIAEQQFFSLNQRLAIYHLFLINIVFAQFLLVHRQFSLHHFVGFDALRKLEEVGRTDRSQPTKTKLFAIFNNLIKHFLADQTLLSAAERSLLRFQQLQTSIQLRQLQSAFSLCIELIGEFIDFENPRRDNPNTPRFSIDVSQVKKVFLIFKKIKNTQ